jgi:hydroxysqualene synthase
VRAATAVLPFPDQAPPAGLPWAAWLFPGPTRRQVTAFCRFAIAADNIADSPALDAEAKLLRLEGLEAGLSGRPGAEPIATALRQAVEGDARLLGDASELLQAFRRDAVTDRCRDWADLMTYCRFSAVPVGRFLLTVHGESEAPLKASDALCTALQVLNHVRDCGEDYRMLGRVYLPGDWLMSAGIEPDALAGDLSSPDLRRVFDAVLDNANGLLELARPLPRQLRRWRLRLEAAVVLVLAQRLSRRLRLADPLVATVHVSALDVVLAALQSLFSLFRHA